jgi:hypothetical protein
MKRRRKMLTSFFLTISTPTLNRVFGSLSALSGVGMITVAPFLHDLATGLSGIGALTVAMVLFQLSDVRERLQRLETVLIESGGDGRAKHHHAG